jgi:hypothetical protein
MRFVFTKIRFVCEMETKMRFEKCLTCPSIKGKQCAGPNFSTATSKENVEWIFAFAKLNGITNAQIATASGVPKGTIDGLKKRDDVRHDTLFPIIKAVIELSGGVWGGESCPAAASGASEQQQENLRLTQELARMKEQMEQITREKKERTRAIYALFGLCAGLVLLLLLLWFLNLRL